MKKKPENVTKTAISHEVKDFKRGNRQLFENTLERMAKNLPVNNQTLKKP